MLVLPPIVRDDPPGTALSVDVAGKIVLTRVKGIPYLLDVLECGPLALLVGDDADRISRTLQRR